jgi:ATP-binding cassette, subfamily C (CFTR/MRP), member 1
VSVPATAVAIATGLATIILVAVEHYRSVRPSSVLQIYLVASIFADAVQIRTLFLRKYVPTIARLQSSILACQVLLLVLESWRKTRWALPAEVPYSPEDFSGILSRSVYFWLNPLLFKGNRQILSIDDLFPYVKLKLEPSYVPDDLILSIVLAEVCNPHICRKALWMLGINVC